MKAILVDDELLLLKELKKMLTSLSNIEIAGTYDDPMQALREAPGIKPELAFLDIEMPGISGIELAERLMEINADMDVLFITAYNHYATEAFAANALDYVLKPVQPKRLLKALERISKKRNQEWTMLPLRIQSFGRFDVYCGNKPVQWNRAKQRELFAYLLNNVAQWVDKFKICDDLWRDSPPDHALANLQTAIWALRKLFKKTGPTEIRIAFAHDSYMLTIGNTPWDRLEFDSLYRSGIKTGALDACRRAEILSHDGYLAGEDWNWAVLERERYLHCHQSLTLFLNKHQGISQ